MREMNIANNGLAYLSSAQVGSISANTIIVDMSWGSTVVTWTIDINTQGGTGGTHFVRADGEAGTINDIKVGDIVAITGMLDQHLAIPTINAQYVRE